MFSKENAVLPTSFRFFLKFVQTNFFKENIFDVSERRLYRLFKENLPFAKLTLGVSNKETNNVELFKSYVVFYCELLANSF
jgi:hypothetical protein